MQLDEIIVHGEECSGAPYQLNVYLGLEKEFKRCVSDDKTLVCIEEVDFV